MGFTDYYAQYKIALEKFSPFGLWPSGENFPWAVLYSVYNPINHAIYILTILYVYIFCTQTQRYTVALYDLFLSYCSHYINFQM